MYIFIFMLHSVHAVGTLKAKATTSVNKLLHPSFCVCKHDYALIHVVNEVYPFIEYSML